LFIARKRGLSVTDGKEIVEAMQKLPEEIKAALKLNNRVKQDAAKLDKFENALYLGRDTLFPIALEGALKLKEISYLHAEGYSSGEMKHGPIALIDENFLTVNLLGKGPLLEKSISNLQEVRARGGYEYVVTDDEGLDESDALIVKTSSPWTAPLVINVCLQMLAYHIAVARGTDVDQPRNLAKSVTVE